MTHFGKTTQLLLERRTELLNRHVEARQSFRKAWVSLIDSMSVGQYDAMAPVYMQVVEAVLDKSKQQPLRAKAKEVRDYFEEKEMLAKDIKDTASKLEDIGYWKERA